MDMRTIQNTFMSHLRPNRPVEAKTEAFIGELERMQKDTHSYFPGDQRDLKDEHENCYSIGAKAAVDAGVISPADARALLARIRLNDTDSFLSVMLPHGYTGLPIEPGPGGVQIPAGPIPRGHLVSLDGGSHVMWSTGRQLPGGGHEVLSFKAGTCADTPVWGEAAGDFMPEARIWRTTLEREIDMLQELSGEPVDNLKVVHGLPGFIR